MMVTATCKKFAVCAVLVVAVVYLYSNGYLSSREIHAEYELNCSSDVTPSEDNELPMNHQGRLVNSLVTEYDQAAKAKLKELTDRKAGSRDPEVISLVRYLMDPPSGHMLKRSMDVFSTPQSDVIMEIFNRKRQGFFIECGALDGERSSNTLYLEQRLGWTGILIEMDPYFYTQLLGKNRKSHSINACLSPRDHVIAVDFNEHTAGQGKLRDPDNTDPQGKERKVPCFPLESILLALNTTHVDFFSLDVEGFELDVLKTIPFDRLDISTLAVEHAHAPAGKDAYKTFMENNGYITYKDIKYKDLKLHLSVNDFIFVEGDLMKAT